MRKYLLFSLIIILVSLVNTKDQPLEEITKSIIERRVKSIFGIDDKGVIDLTKTVGKKPTSATKKEPDIDLDDWNDFLNKFAKYAQKYTKIFENIRDVSHDLIQLRTIAGAANLRNQPPESLQNLIDSIQRDLRKLDNVSIKITTEKENLTKKSVKNFFTPSDSQEREKVLNHLDFFVQMLAIGASTFQTALTQNPSKIYSMQEIQQKVEEIFSGQGSATKWKTFWTEFTKQIFRFERVLKNFNEVGQLLAESSPQSINKAQVKLTKVRVQLNDLGGAEFKGSTEIRELKQLNALAQSLQNVINLKNKS